MFKTIITDPGILIKNDNFFRVKKLDYSFKTNIFVKKNGFIKNLRFCSTCMIYRPPNTSHCKKCNNCILIFDHHCDLLGNCIGKRNYKYFILFLINSSLLCLFGFVISMISAIIHLKSYGSNGNEYIFINNQTLVIIFSFGLLLTTLIIFLILFKLLYYHILIISLNLTTYQELKKNYRNDAEFILYNSSFKIKNFYNRIFSRYQSRYFDPSAEYIQNFFMERHNQSQQRSTSDTINNQNTHIKQKEYSKNRSLSQGFPQKFSENINTETELIAINEDHNIITSTQAVEIQMEKNNSELISGKSILTQKIFSDINSSIDQEKQLDNSQVINIIIDRSFNDDVINIEDIDDLHRSESPRLKDLNRSNEKQNKIYMTSEKCVAEIFSKSSHMCNDYSNENIKKSQS